MTEETKNLGDYGGELNKLTQDQMLGQGGGVIFYEIIDHAGNVREHMAMPCLLRDRPKVKAAMRKHAIATTDMAKLFSPQSSGLMGGENTTDFADKISQLEEIDTDALLTIAYYSFKRTDAVLSGLDEEAGKAALMNWMDERQLREILKVALGLNRFEIPSLMGAAM